MKKIEFTPLNLAYAAISIAVLALAITGYMYTRLDGYVERGVREAVVVTKIRIAELEAGAKLSAARGAFLDRKDFTKLRESVIEASDELSAVYAQASEQQQSAWPDLKAQFDAVIELTKQKDPTTLAKVDALIARLRKESVPTV